MWYIFVLVSIVQFITNIKEMEESTDPGNEVALEEMMNSLAVLKTLADLSICAREM